MRMKPAAGKIVLLISVSCSRLSSMGHPWWLDYGCSNSGRDSFLLRFFSVQYQEKHHVHRKRNEKI